MVGLHCAGVLAHPSLRTHTRPSSQDDLADDVFELLNNDNDDDMPGDMDTDGDDDNKDD